MAGASGGAATEPLANITYGSTDMNLLRMTRATMPLLSLAFGSTDPAVTITATNARINAYRTLMSQRPGGSFAEIEEIGSASPVHSPFMIAPLPACSIAPRPSQRPKGARSLGSPVRPFGRRPSAPVQDTDANALFSIPRTGVADDPPYRACRSRSGE